VKTYVVAALPVYKVEDVKLVEAVEADFVELRLDYMGRLEVDLDFLERFKDKLILTIRDVREGGVKEIQDEEKEAFLRELHRRGFLYDVEASFLERRRVEYIGKIVSAHYFNSVPSVDELEKTYEKYKEAFVVKFAVVGRGNYKGVLASMLKYDNVAVMPMGVPPLERIAFSILGSRLVYGYVKEPTAPGQMHYKALLEILKILRNY
jgi:3-dehydroquinate dehydratase-1